MTTLRKAIETHSLSPRKVQCMKHLYSFPENPITLFFLFFSPPINFHLSLSLFSLSLLVYINPQNPTFILHREPTIREKIKATEKRREQFSFPSLCSPAAVEVFFLLEKIHFQEEQQSFCSSDTSFIYISLQPFDLSYSHSIIIKWLALFLRLNYFLMLFASLLPGEFFSFLFVFVFVILLLSAEDYSLFFYSFVGMGCETGGVTRRHHRIRCRLDLVGEGV